MTGREFLSSADHINLAVLTAPRFAHQKLLTRNKKQSGHNMSSTKRLIAWHMVTDWLPETVRGKGQVCDKCPKNIIFQARIERGAYLLCESRRVLIAHTHTCARSYAETKQSDTAKL